MIGQERIREHVGARRRSFHLRRRCHAVRDSAGFLESLGGPNQVGIDEMAREAADSGFKMVGAARAAKVEAVKRHGWCLRPS